MATARTILLRGCFEHEENPAVAALSPGHLLERVSTGKVQKHSTQGGYASLMFAKEDAQQGRSVDTAYAANEIVFCAVAHKGAIVNALLLAGVSYAIGDKLISDGAGRLKKLSAATTTTLVKQPIAEIYEALNLSASGAVDTLGKVQVY